MHKFKGDTLVEVAIAIGIFSMVAISVVAVVSASTSSTQSALETTVTREEIDIQAEALRFIQASYIAGGQANQAGQTKYDKIWKAITSRALDASTNKAVYDAAVTYSPSTCDDLYQSGNNYKNIYDQKAFIINTKNLGVNFSELDLSGVNYALSQIVVPATTDNDVFKQASTYPRLVYDSTSEALSGENDTLVYDSLKNAEGLYIIAVKDSRNTNIVSGKDGKVTSKAAYYDFYIRSCWYAPGADKPSTISTVIRLYDPNVIEY
jgi:hypothetical protein